MQMESRNMWGLILETFLRKVSKSFEGEFCFSRYRNQSFLSPNLCCSRADGLHLWQQCPFRYQASCSWFWTLGPNYCQPARLGHFWKLNQTSPCAEIAIRPLFLWDSLVLLDFTFSFIKWIECESISIWKDVGSYCCPFSSEWANECVHDNN